MEFPEPVISVAVEPSSKPDQEKMGIALGKLAQEDPSFRVKTDEETGQTIISGMGELHLDIHCRPDAANLASRPTLASRRWPTGKRFATRPRLKASLCVSPVVAASMAMSGSSSSPQRTKRAEGLEFVNEIVGGSVPKEYIPAVQKGIRGADAKRGAGGLSTAWPEGDAV